MNRKEFVKLCSVLGITMPMAVMASSCSKDDNPIESGEKVIVIGAGPAGMSAAHLLAQKGVDYEILEALPTYGGRI